MNWLTNYIKPKLQSLIKKKDIPKNLWIKCQNGCGSMIYYEDFEKSLGVCTQCGIHMRLSSNIRLKFLFDEGKYEKIKHLEWSLSLSLTLLVYQYQYQSLPLVAFHILEQLGNPHPVP